MKMQQSFLMLALLVPVALLIFGFKRVGLSAEAKVRPAYVAGGFYPADANELGKMIDGFLAQGIGREAGRQLGGADLSSRGLPILRRRGSLLLYPA